MAESILSNCDNAAKPYEPKVYGRLTIIGESFPKPVGTKGKKKLHVECLCSCGTVKIYQLANLKSGITRSCGCLNRERNASHGHSPRSKVSPEYNSWKCMIRRCKNHNAINYKSYGGRGIKVCQRWQTFENFLVDMGKRPSSQHSLDRVDMNGDYCPENCRWATRSEQANNTRRNRFITAFGKTQTMQQWADEIGVSRDTLRYRIDRHNWPVEKALTTPSKSQKLQKPN